MHSRARSWHGRAVWIAALLAWGCDAPTGPVGPATHLAFTAGPKTQFSSVTFAQVVQVRAEDADGRVVTGFNGEVTVALSVHRGAATALRGTTTVTATDGMASFADLAIEGVDSRNVLIASTPALAPGRSDAFASQPVHLVFTVQPRGVIEGRRMAPSIEVTTQDALGHIVTGFRGQVKLSDGEGSYDTSLRGVRTETAVDGVASFPDIVESSSGSGFQLFASSPGAISGRSTVFTIQP